MSYERFTQLVTELCAVIDLPDPESVLNRRAIEIDGFEVLLENFENDPNALYMNFHFGIVTAGRTLRIFSMLLEANLSVYAQDQGQMGVNPDTGGVILILRVPMSDDIDGSWLAETLVHYAEHGRYWQKNALESTDEMFLGVCAGDYTWLRA